MKHTPPPLPSAQRPRVFFLLLGALAGLVCGFLIGRASVGLGAPSERAEFSGNRHGQPAREEFQRGADWLLEQDRKRAR